MVAVKFRASLDSGGKVPTSQLPDSVLGALKYQGTWNASTNSPTIPAAASGNLGYYYRVATAGTTDIDGETDWGVKDWLVSNGTIWQKIDNSEPTYSSAIDTLLAAADAGEARTALSVYSEAEVDALPLDDDLKDVTYGTGDVRPATQRAVAQNFTNEHARIAGINFLTESGGVVTLPARRHAVRIDTAGSTADITNITPYSGHQSGDRLRVYAQTGKTLKFQHFFGGDGRFDLKGYQDANGEIELVGDSNYLDFWLYAAGPVWHLEAPVTQADEVRVKDTAGNYAGNNLEDILAEIGGGGGGGGGSSDNVSWTGNGTGTVDGGNWASFKAALIASANAGKMIVISEPGTYRMDVPDETVTLIAKGFRTVTGAELVLHIGARASWPAYPWRLTDDKAIDAKIRIGDCEVDGGGPGSAYLFQLRGSNIDLKLDFDAGMTFDGTNANSNWIIGVTQIADSGTVEKVRVHHSTIKNYIRCFQKSVDSTAKTNYFTFEHNHCHASTASCGINSPKGESKGHNFSNNHFYGYAEGSVTNGSWGSAVNGTNMQDPTIENNVFYGRFVDCIHLEEAGRNITIRGNKALNLKGSFITLRNNVYAATSALDLGGTYHALRGEISGNIGHCILKTEEVTARQHLGVGLIGISGAGEEIAAENILIHHNILHGFDYGVSERTYDDKKVHYASVITNNEIADCRLGLRLTYPNPAHRDNVLIDNDYDISCLESGMIGPQHFVTSDWTEGARMLTPDVDNAVTGRMLMMKGFTLSSRDQMPSMGSGLSIWTPVINLANVVKMTGTEIALSLIDNPSGAARGLMAVWAGFDLTGTTVTNETAIYTRSTGASFSPQFRVNAGKLEMLVNHSNPEAMTFNMAFEWSGVMVVDN